MKNRVIAAFFIAAGLLVAGAPVLAHHGAASFDKSWNDLMACIESKSAVMRKAS